MGDEGGLLLFFAPVGAKPAVGVVELWESSVVGEIHEIQLGGSITKKIADEVVAAQLQGS